MSAGRAAAAAVIAACALAAPAGAADVVGYDGGNPFACTLQQAGTGATVADPRADPLCVEYDKTQQNVTRGGLVEFLSHEPARVALAAPACWYYQRDHWRGSIDQHDEGTETYNWDGGYFWDKARGVFGVHAAGFSIGNHSFDPSALPGFPAHWKPFFGHGRGGVQVLDGIPVDPECVRKAARVDPYARRSPPPAAPAGDLALEARRHGCHRRGALVRLTGRDVERVFAVEFRFRGRRIGRQERAPFGVGVARRRLGRRGGTLVADALLRGGERFRGELRLSGCGRRRA